jgi:hypothetical protein
MLSLWKELMFAPIPELGMEEIAEIPAPARAIMVH